MTFWTSLKRARLWISDCPCVYSQPSSVYRRQGRWFGQPLPRLPLCQIVLSYRPPLIFNLFLAKSLCPASLTSRLRPEEEKMRDACGGSGGCDLFPDLSHFPIGFIRAKAGASFWLPAWLVSLFTLVNLASSNFDHGLPPTHPNSSFLGNAACQEEVEEG